MVIPDNFKIADTIVNDGAVELSSVGLITNTAQQQDLFFLFEKRVFHRVPSYVQVKSCRPYPVEGVAKGMDTYRLSGQAP